MFPLQTLRERERDRDRSATNIHELSTRTVTMSRDQQDQHGFGICVKGGKDSGHGVYVSRIEEGSLAERAGLRPGDTILEVNGTPFTSVSHEEALKVLHFICKLFESLSTIPFSCSCSFSFVVVIHVPFFIHLQLHGQQFNHFPPYSYHFSNIKYHVLVIKCSLDEFLDLIQTNNETFYEH